MKLRNKKTGETPDKIETITYIQWSKKIMMAYINNDGERIVKQYDSLEAFNEEWEDYEETLPFFNKSIRDAIRVWWKLQENPFKCASVLCINDRKDKDGFYNYHIYGYIREGENKIATEFQFRTKCYYEYEHHKDYTLEELCGGKDE